MNNVNKKIKNKVCVISLTFGRPEYIKRSFESLYKHAGLAFDLYIFDDCSDKKTIKVLKELQKKYKFTLFTNKERQHIYKNFYKHIDKIPLDYDYYVKFDSDIEILSDNLFPQMIENFKFSNDINGLTVRVEGVRNIDRYDAQLEFYNGHVVKFDAPVVYGCCMMLTKNVLCELKRFTDVEFKKINEKWAIDTVLYDTALKLGKFLIIEDLSVYHIGNTYGQRRDYPEYFIDRKRWDKIDVDEVWYMQVSKKIYPKHLTRNTYDRLKRESTDFEDFLAKCKEYRNDIILDNEMTKVEHIHHETPINKIMHIKTMYKITSPLNFRSDPHIEHGSFKYFSKIPEWAKNNIRVVVEKENIKNESSNLGKREEGNEKELKEKTVHKCKYCNYANTSLRRLKTHYQMKHKGRDKNKNK